MHIFNSIPSQLPALGREVNGQTFRIASILPPSLRFSGTCRFVICFGSEGSSHKLTPQGVNCRTFCANVR